jgi:dihydroorotase
MYIDSHVHFRDWEKQKHKETVKHGLEVAIDSGLSAVFDMPNTYPAITTEEIALRRLKLAERVSNNDVFYGVYLGATANPEQLKRAVDTVRKHRQVVGIKLYAGESVGDLAVINPIDQLIVYGTLAQEGYEEVLVVHAEKEDKMHRSFWNPSIPISHCIARPPEAEVESVKEQIALSKYTKFPGKLHIAHISCIDSVEQVNKAKSNGLDISCEITPHHLIYDMSKMLNFESGIFFKMNPPLRPIEQQQLLLHSLKIGKIDFLVTDHAPHTLKEKIENPFMSGIPGTPWYPLFAEYLRSNDFSNKRIEEVLFSKIAQRFDLDIIKRYNPIKDRRKDYAFDPFIPAELDLKMDEVW